MTDDIPRVVDASGSVVVRNCHGCPAANWNSLSCSLRSAYEGRYPIGDTPPEWCPLRKGQVTLTLDENLPYPERRR